MMTIELFRRATPEEARVHDCDPQGPFVQITKEDIINDDEMAELFWYLVYGG